MSTLKRDIVADKLINDLSEQILNGKLKAGEPILSLNQLVVQYGISKSSVKKAVDQLAQKGLLKKMHGKGIFVPDRLPAKKSNGSGNGRISQIGLSYPANIYTTHILSEIKDYVMGRNGMLTVYDVAADQQDPSRERVFLEHMSELGVRGIAIFASPIEPVNTALFNQLRLNGIKVALLSPYKYDMDDQVCFLPDSRLLGYKAVESLAKRGCKNICFATKHMPGHPVYVQWIEEGIFSACRNLEVKKDEKTVALNLLAQGERLTFDELMQRNKHIPEILSSLPAHTGIVCRNLMEAQLLAAYRRRLKNLKGQIIEFFSCMPSSSYENEPAIPGADDDQSNLLRATVDYLLDDSIPADFIFQRYFAPKVSVQE